MEFYLGFYEILGFDLLYVFEDYRVTKQVHPSFNSTFIVWIPKSDPPHSFDDFQTISLQNYIFKIIAKIIANRLKLFLPKNI